jgi:hypothetical protein
MTTLTNVTATLAKQYQWSNTDGSTMTILVDGWRCQMQVIDAASHVHNLVLISGCWYNEDDGGGYATNQRGWMDVWVRAESCMEMLDEEADLMAKLMKAEATDDMVTAAATFEDGHELSLAMQSEGIDIKRHYGITWVKVS